MSKEIELIWNGKPEKFVINDRPNFGLVAKCVEGAVNMITVSGMPEIKHREYGVALACNLIEKSPWGGAASPQVLYEHDSAEVEALLAALGDILPLDRFLSLGGKLTYGKKFVMPQSPSGTESITPLPSGESVKLT